MKIEWFITLTSKWARWRLNHQRLDCLLDLLWLFCSCAKSKNTPKLCITGLSQGEPAVTGGFPSQRASNAENVSIWWRHRVEAIQKEKREGNYLQYSQNFQSEPCTRNKNNRRKWAMLLLEGTKITVKTTMETTMFVFRRDSNRPP